MIGNKIRLTSASIIASAAILGVGLMQPVFACSTANNGEQQSARQHSSDNNKADNNKQDQEKNKNQDTQNKDKDNDQEADKKGGNDKDSDDTNGGVQAATSCDKSGAALVSSVTFTINGKNYSDLRGHASSGDTVKATFNMAPSCTGPVSLVSYTAPSASFSRDSAGQQQVFDSKSGNFTGNGNVLSVNLPGCFYQVDFVEGAVITHFGPSNTNNYYSDQNRLISGDNGGSSSCSSPSPIPSPSPSPSGGTGGVTSTPTPTPSPTGTPTPGPTSTPAPGPTSTPAGGTQGITSTPTPSPAGGTQAATSTPAGSVQAASTSGPVGAVQALTTPGTGAAIAWGSAGILLLGGGMALALSRRKKEENEIV